MAETSIPKTARALETVAPTITEPPPEVSPPIGVAPVVIEPADLEKEKARLKAEGPQLPVPEQATIDDVVAERVKAYEALDIPGLTETFAFRRSAVLTGGSPQRREEIAEKGWEDYETARLEATKQGLPAPPEPVHITVDKPDSWRDVVPYHAAKVGMTPDAYRAAAVELNYPLELIEEQVGREGLSPEAYAQLAKERRIPYHLDPADRDTDLRGEVIKTYGAVRKPWQREEIFKDVKTGVVKVDRTALDAIGLEETRPPEVARPGEDGYEWAGTVSLGVLGRDASAHRHDKYSTTEYGWAPFIQEELEDEAKRRGIQLGSQEWDDHYRSGLNESIRTIAALKTVGLWTAPVFIPLELDDQGRMRMPPPDEMSLWQSLHPAVEVLGFDREGRVVIRQDSALKWVFDVTDLFQSATAGVLDEYLDREVVEGTPFSYPTLSDKEDKDWQTAATRGIAERRTFLGEVLYDPQWQAAIASGLAEGDTDAEFWGAVGTGLLGLGATFLFPDALVGVAGARKAVGGGLTFARLGKADWEAAQLLRKVAIDGAAQELTSVADADLRALAPEIAAELDAGDYRVAEYLSSEAPGIVGDEAKALGERLPEGIDHDSWQSGEANPLRGATATKPLSAMYPNAHPATRKKLLSATVDGTSVLGQKYSELHNKQRVLDSLAEAATLAEAKSPVLLVKDFRRELLRVPTDPATGKPVKGAQSPLEQLDDAAAEEWLSSASNLSEILLNPDHVGTAPGAAAWGPILNVAEGLRKNEKLFEGYSEAIKESQAAVGAAVESRAIAAAMLYNRMRQTWRLAPDAELISDLAAKAAPLEEISADALEAAREIAEAAGMPRGEVAAVARSLDVIAQKWAQNNNASPRRFWQERYAGVRRGEAPEPLPEVDPANVPPLPEGATWGARSRGQREGISPEELFAQLANLEGAAAKVDGLDVSAARVVEFLAKYATTPGTQALAQRLVATGTLDGVLVRVIHHSDALGHYRPPGERPREVPLIEVRGAGPTVTGLTEQTLLHELTHAATSAYIFKHQGSAEVKALDNLAKAIDGYAQKRLGEEGLDPTLKSVLKNITGTKALGAGRAFDAEEAAKLGAEEAAKRAAELAATRAAELVAYAFESGEFQDLLKGLKLSDLGLEAPEAAASVWSEFVKLMRSLLKLTDEETTALTEILAQTEVIFKKVKVTPDEAPGAADLLAVAPETPEFQRWFSGSKVVDDAGEPRVVYHGTAGDFDAFKNPYADDVAGGGWHMFAEDAAYANRFAPAHVEGSSVLPVYLSIKNPLDLTALPARRGDVRVKLIRALKRAGINPDSLKIPHETDLFRFINQRGFRAQLKNAAQEAGYDGISFSDIHRRDDKLRDRPIESITHVAFEPNQIKSTSNVRPTEDPRILFATAPETPEFQRWSKGLPVIKAGDELPEGGAVVEAYHGTYAPRIEEFGVDGPPREFDEFDELAPTRGSGDPNAYMGAHFGTPETAAKFAGVGGASPWLRDRTRTLDAEGGAGQTYPVYLRLESPLRMTEDALLDLAFRAGRLSDDALLEETLIRQFDYTDATIDDGWAKYESDVDFREGVNQAAFHLSRKIGDASGELHESVLRELGEAAREALIARGHDGVVYRNMIEGGGDSYIVFEPNQIKSTLNRGAFAPDDPRILYATAPGLEDAVDGKDVRFYSKLEQVVEGLNDVYKAQPAVVTAATEPVPILYTRKSKAVRRGEAKVGDPVIDPTTGEPRFTSPRKSAELPARSLKDVVLEAVRGTGVKEEEIRWTNLEEFLDDLMVRPVLHTKKSRAVRRGEAKVGDPVVDPATGEPQRRHSVTRDELLSHLRENRVVVDEVSMGVLPPAVKAVKAAAAEAFIPLTSVIRTTAKSLTDAPAPGGRVPWADALPLDWALSDYDVTSLLHKVSADPQALWKWAVPWPTEGRATPLSHLEEALERADAPNWGPRPESRVPPLPLSLDVPQELLDTVRRLDERWQAAAQSPGHWPIRERLSELREFSKQLDQWTRPTRWRAPAIQRMLTSINNLADQLAGHTIPRMELATRVVSSPEWKPWLLLTEEARVAEKAANVDAPEHGGWRLPGGENYREVLITRPVESQKILADPEVRALARVARLSLEGVPPSGPRVDLPKAPRGVGANAPVAKRAPALWRKVAARYGIPDDTKFVTWFKAHRARLFTSAVEDGSHWASTPNVLVHLRATDRVDEAGRKLLFIEEIQSDWHQKGRVGGYTSDVEKTLQPLKDAFARMEREAEITADWRKAHPRTESVKLGSRLEVDAELFADGRAVSDVFGDARQAKIAGLSPRMRKAWDDYVKWEDERQSFFEAGQKRVAKQGEVLDQLVSQSSARTGLLARVRAQSPHTNPPAAVYAQRHVVYEADQVGLRLTPAIEGGGDRPLVYGFTYPHSRTILPNERFLQDTIEKHSRGRVPDAPFKDTKAWAGLAVKRALQIAADEGYDGVAFTSGEIAATVVHMPYDSAVEFYDKILPSVVRKYSDAPLEKTTLPIEPGADPGLVDPEALQNLPEEIVVNFVPSAQRRPSFELFATAPELETPEFKRWFGASKVVDEADEPLVVYHGTPGVFDRFERGSVQGAFGSSIYFSDSTVDVGRNYARLEGPDIQARVNLAIDRIDSLDDFDGDDILAAARQVLTKQRGYAKDTARTLAPLIAAEDVDGLIDAYEPELIEVLARQQALGDMQFNVHPVYLRMTNPVYLDPTGKKGRTVFELEYVYDEAGDIVDETGSAIRLFEAIDEVAPEFDGARAPAIKALLLDDLADGELDATTLMQLIREGQYRGGGIYIYDPDTGDFANTEFVRAVFEHMGFDGIVADAYFHFGPSRGPSGARQAGMEGVKSGTYHYMVFEPTQIKSTLNRGTFDPADPRTLHATPPRAPGGPARPPTPPTPDRVEVTWEDGRAVLTAFGAPTLRDFTLAIGEVVRRTLSDDDLDTVVKWLKVEHGLEGLSRAGAVFTGDSEVVRKAEEIFAAGFERHLREREVSAGRLQQIYENLKSTLADLARAVSASRAAVPVRMSGEVTALMERLVSEAPPSSRGILPTAMRFLKSAAPEPMLPTGRGVSFAQELAEQARHFGIELTATKITDDYKQAAAAAAPGEHFDVITLERNVLPHRKGIGRLEEGADGKQRYVLTDNDLSKLQAALELEEAVVQASRRDPRLAVLSPAHRWLEAEETPVDFLDQLSQGGRASRDSSGQGVSESILTNVTLAAARVGRVTIFGGDSARDLRLLPPVMRNIVLAGERLVSHAIGESVRLVTQRSPEDIYRFLAGERVEFTRGGRSATSSGYIVFIDHAMRMVNSRYAEDADLLSELSRALFVSDARTLRSLGKKEQEELLEMTGRLLSGEDDLFAEGLLEAVDLRMPFKGDQTKPPRLLEALAYYSRTSERAGKKFTGGPLEQAEGLLKDVEEIFGEPAALRTGVVLAAHGASDSVRLRWSRAGLGIPGRVMEAFKDYAIGKQIDPAMLPDVLEATRRFGLQSNFFEDAALAGAHVPKAARIRLGNALARTSQKVDPVAKGLNTPEENLTGGFRTFYWYLKTSFTRGAFAVRQRYFLMNTMDSFVQMALEVGLRPALAHTARVIAQDFMVMPGVARGIWAAEKAGALDPRAAERFRRVLQKGGDKAAHAVETLLGGARYRLEVNPILDGVPGTFLVGNKVYSYADIKRIAVEEGIFSSFEASRLETAVKNARADALAGIASAGGKTQARVKNILNEVLEMTSDTAEAWADRERLGAMVTLMEFGVSPRVAAQLTVRGLYDYAGSMAKIDRLWIVNLFLPFWAFQKNATRQVVNRIFSPQGAYLMGAIRRFQEGSTELLSEFLYGSVADPYGMDVRSMPPEMRDAYYSIRQTIEYGYGDLDQLDPEMASYLEERYGPIGELDPEIRNVLENGYGGPANVPDDVRRSMIMIFSGRKLLLEKGEVYTLDAALARRASQHDFSPYYIEKPSPSGTARYARDRPRIQIPAHRTAEMAAYHAALANSGNLYDRPYLELLLPEPTIHAGFRHITYTTALYIKMGQWMTQGMPGDPVDPDALQYATINTFTEIVDPERSIIPGAILASLDYADAAPVRIHPALQPEIERMFPGMLIRSVAKGDPSSTEAVGKEAQEVRYYLPPGISALAFSATPLRELNNVLLTQGGLVGLPQGDPGKYMSPLEQASGTRGQAVYWAEAVLGAQSLETSPGRTARREAPKTYR